MGFRIHRGIFQKLNDARTAYENTFKIDSDGRIKEVDSDGNVTAGYLKVGEQATDANLLDGINSSQFLRSDVNDTMGGNLTLRYSSANSDDYLGLTFANDSAAGLNDYIIKASSSRGVFGRKSFGWHVHTNSAFGVYSNGWTKLFGVEGGTGNAFAVGSFNANQLTVSGSTNSGRFYSDSWGIKIGTTSGHIQFGPANNDWAHIYTDRPNFYFNKNLYVSGNRLATESWVASRGYLTSETDSQTLTFNSSNGELTISNGNTVDLDSRYLDATSRKTWYNINAASQQAKRYTIGRVYYCPAHWDDTWMNIEFKLTEETYSGAYVKYSLFGYYNGSQNQTIDLKVTDYRGLPSDTRRYNLHLGEHTAAGWNHSNQPVYYSDIYVDVSYYKGLKVMADTLGHSWQSTEPTSGAAITVFYGTPRVQDIEYTNVEKENTYVGYDTLIWNTNNFSSTNVSNWNTAYGWGNHASAGYQPSGTYADGTTYQTYGTGNNGWLMPDYDNNTSNFMRMYYDDGSREFRMYSRHGSSSGEAKIALYDGGVFNTISSTNIAEFKTAYSWGNHASAGYLTSVPSEYLTQTEGDARYINVGSDTMTGILKLDAGVTNNNWSTFTHLQGANSLNNPSGTVGAIRIELPTAEYNTNTMMSMTIKVYEYSTGKSFTLFCGGYNYGNNHWYNCFATLLGDNQRGDVPVRFGHNEERNVIWIGNPDWSWSYPNVWVTDFQSGHTQRGGWNDGWNIVFDRSAAINVTATETAHQQISTANISSYTNSYLPLAGGTMTGGLTTNSTITSTKNGTAFVMDGGSSAEGVRMQADTDRTYPVFLRSLNPGSGGETSAWIFKENNTAWGIWHNNPINTVDFTRSPASGIENDVGGGDNTVMIRLDMQHGHGRFAGNVYSDGGNSTNWNTAYSWGNHASAGYLTSFDITTQTDSKYVRSDVYDTTYNGLQVHRDIGNINGSWTADHHTLGLETQGTGNIVINFHRAGHTSHNLRYNGSQFRFDDDLESTGVITASGGNSTNWNTAYTKANAAPYINSSTSDSRGPDFDALLPSANQTTYKEVHAINEGTNFPSGAYTYGVVHSQYMTSMKFQWYVPHTASRGNSDTQDTIYFRTNWGSGNWYGWKYLIHSGNIAGQSVNYANSAGSVAWSNVSGKPSTFTPSNHAASKVTSGTFANARISQSSVTQHQGALSIAASQVSGLPAQTPPVTTTAEGGEPSTLRSIHFSPGEGAATFTLADGSTYRLAFAR